MKFLLNLSRVIAALFAGSIINMCIVWLGQQWFPAPADFKNALPLHFLFPFLAHAFGTLSGAMLMCWLKPKETRRYALIVGIIFLIGGISACFMIPAPWWFIAADLLLAYIPMALIGAYFYNKLVKP
jgi:uncharacterized membrane protein